MKPGQRPAAAGWNRGKSARKDWLIERASYDGEECLIWPYAHVRGYGHFVVYQTKFYAHRFMCELINGSPPTPEHQASHECGNGHKGCVHPKHLSWKTQSENQLDRRQHGTMARNSLGRVGKLSQAVVEKIRSLAGTKTQDEVAAMFKITRGHVQFIQSGKSRVRIFGLERQRIKAVLAKSPRPMMPFEIQKAAYLPSRSSAQGILTRMVEAGILVQTGYGHYALPQPPP